MLCPTWDENYFATFELVAGLVEMCQSYLCLHFCYITRCPCLIHASIDISFMVDTSLEVDLCVNGYCRKERNGLKKREHTFGVTNTAAKLYDGGVICEPRAKEWVT